MTKDNRKVWCFVLGLLSTLLYLTGPLALTMGICSLCLKQKDDKGIATAGLVLGIIGIVLSAIYTLTWGLIFINL